MTRRKRGRKKKRQPNSGSFTPGHDPRRHVFTREQRQQGYATAMSRNDATVVAFVFRKVRGYYRERKRNGPKESRCTA